VACDDTQGATNEVFPDPTSVRRVAVNRPEFYGTGQTITITGAGAGGADLIARVDDIDNDELVLDRDRVDVRHPVVDGHRGDQRNHHHRHGHRVQY
jgi:hypothetical protein